jgi:glycerol uptake facilitator-like aquaporin
MAQHPLWRRLVAEFLGSGFLAAVVVGSGIAAQRLSPGDVGLELFENAAATGAGLFAIISMFGPISGAHLNPVVSFVDAGFGGLRWKHALAYVPAQIAGCIGGAVLANLMFGAAAVTWSTEHRATGAHFLSEVVATLGLVLVIFALARTGRSRMAPAAVGAYIGAAYFFTSSTSFANPAITLGRMFSDSFAGIAPASAPTFIGAQVVGGLVAFGVIKTIYPKVTPAEAADVVFPHRDDRVAISDGVDGRHAEDGQLQNQKTDVSLDAELPGSHRIRMRTTGDAASRRLLGVQLFGHRHAEVAKRIDIVASAIFSDLRVDEINDLDLSHTPPLGSPWDVVQGGAQAWVRQSGS